MGLEIPPASELLRDHALRPRQQDKFIRNVGGCQVRELDSGHDAMISHPHELAAILNPLVPECY